MEKSCQQQAAEHAQASKLVESYNQVSPDLHLGMPGPETAYGLITVAVTLICLSRMPIC